MVGGVLAIILDVLGSPRQTTRSSRVVTSTSAGAASSPVRAMATSHRGYPARPAAGNDQKVFVTVFGGTTRRARSRLHREVKEVAVERGRTIWVVGEARPDGDDRAERLEE